jgi:hypothetical protein
MATEPTLVTPQNHISVGHRTPPTPIFPFVTNNAVPLTASRPPRYLRWYLGTGSWYHRSVSHVTALHTHAKGHRGLRHGICMRNWVPPDDVSKVAQSDGGMMAL